MLYSMPLVADDGRRFHLDGYKQIRDEDGMDLWSDTTTLYVTVHEGEGTSGPVAAKGIVTIHAADFAKQMTTMRGVGGSPLDQLKAMATFGRMFAGALNESFGGVFARPSAFIPDAAPREHRALTCGPGEAHFFRTDDDVELRLTRFNGRPEGPGHPGARLRQLRDRLPARHHRAEPARAPPRGGLRRVAARLPRQPVAGLRLDAVHPRRHRDVRLSGRRPHRARDLRRRDRPGDGPLHRVGDVPDGARARARRASATASPRR